MNLRIGDTAPDFEASTTEYYSRGFTLSVRLIHGACSSGLCYFRSVPQLM